MTFCFLRIFFYLLQYLQFFLQLSSISLFITKSQSKSLKNLASFVVKLNRTNCLYDFLHKVMWSFLLNSWILQRHWYLKFDLKILTNFKSVSHFLFPFFVIGLHLLLGELNSIFASLLLAAVSLENAYYIGCLLFNSLYLLITFSFYISYVWLPTYLT